MTGHVAIIGPMGVGKTTLARRLAAECGVAMRDSDTDIETLLGRSGRQIAETDGVPALHQLEAAVLLGALAAPGPSVIAAAGSVIEDGRCRLALGRRAIVVVLGLPVDDLIDRMAGGGHRRAMDRDEVEALVLRRQPLFDGVADVHLEADRPPDRLVEDVMAAVDPWPGGN